ncbi:hypothetical protein PHYPSEUDO_007820 [Phytophthora pseudosyringae]|uniref:Uncharacterized protein n=1 Tax=Phytophthora pseudosyringae TaxID=221518 RepID=A0A8T1VKX9_9STRA|nr:hypothetical protein PHYPSEUDO_007820 [Phytophthora pseudosyringae]
MSASFCPPVPGFAALGEAWGVAKDRSASSCGGLQTLVAAATRAAAGADREEEEEEAATSGQTPAKKKRVYKKRKSTHTVRKEERQALEGEIQQLEAELDALKLRALGHSGHKDASLRQQMEHNALLRDAVQEQHLVTARTQAMLVGCAQRHSYNVRPTETYIHLAADQAQRFKTLDAMRGAKLHSARRFIVQRSLGLHPTADYLNEERYETPEGDFCNVRFDRTVLRGVAGGVRAVLDALKHAVFNAEIVLSEASGNITIREDDDMDEIKNFSQMKLATQTTRDVLVENNLVHFSELVQADKESDSYALATTDFVDKDDRFPYRPHERLRRDATSIILVTSHTDDPSWKHADSNSYSGHTSSEEDGESVVVMTRWTFTRICHTNLHIPTQALREMRDWSGQVSETILSCVRETLGLHV